MCGRRGKINTSLGGILGITVSVAVGGVTGHMLGGGFPWGLVGVVAGGVVALPFDKYCGSTRPLHKLDPD